VDVCDATLAQIASYRSCYEELNTPIPSSLSDLEQTIQSGDISAVRKVLNKRVLVILRGVSGSGKSTLSNHILENTTEHGCCGFICSTDHFFEQTGTYVFNPQLLGRAHSWNQERCAKAIAAGLSPILIDNTNTQKWECKAYVQMAIEQKYEVFIKETTTPWCKDAHELARRNQHGVPLSSIQRMLARWETDFTVENILACHVPRRGRSPSGRSGGHKKRTGSRSPASHPHSSSGRTSRRVRSRSRGASDDRPSHSDSKLLHTSTVTTNTDWQQVSSGSEAARTQTREDKVKITESKPTATNVFALLGDSD